MSYYNRSTHRNQARPPRAFTPGRVERVNARPGDCRSCHEHIPAGAGQLWRESDGSWSVVHVEQSQGGWLMHPQPVRGGCPESTDKRNAELHASGFLGPDAPVLVSEREHIASTARMYAARNATDAPRQAGPGDDLREVSRRAGSKYAYTSSGARMTMLSRRCEDAPCCGCCD